MDDAQIERWFPAILPHEYEITSPADTDYNCIAWAAGRDDIPWWPIDAPGVFLAGECAFRTCAGSLCCSICGAGILSLLQWGIGTGTRKNRHLRQHGGKAAT